MAEEAGFTMEDLIETGKKYEAAYNGDITSGAVLLGQSIGIINAVKKVPDIIEEVVADAEKRIKTLSSYVK